MLNMKKYICILLLVLMLLCAGAAAEIKTLVPDWASNAFTLPEGVNVVETAAFEGDSMSELVIPASVTSVATRAFANCVNLKRIVVLTANAEFAANSLGTKNDDIEIWGFLGSTAESYADSYGYTFHRIYSYEESLVETATSRLKSLTGEKYVRGRWDCVLFVRWCYKEALDITLPASCVGMQELGTSSFVKNQRLTARRIDSIEDMKTGDIICWKDDTNNYCTHVGMYVGAGTAEGEYHSEGVFIENSSSFGGVRYKYIGKQTSSTYIPYYIRNFICAWRVLP